MLNKQLSIPPIVLPKEVPEILPMPKFRLGQSVRWSCVPTSDYGRVVGVVYGAEGSVQMIGFHYAIALDAASPSFADGITSDWGFEDDLELVVIDEAAGDRPEVNS